MAFATITTIVTPAPCFDLVTLDVVKDELGISTDTENHWMRAAIARASAAIAQYCNRTLVAEVLRDEFWPTRDSYPYIVPGGLSPLQLSRWPVISVTVVTENGISLADGVDYRTDLAKGQLQRLDGNGYPKKWPAFPLKVEYTAGFFSIPPDIQDAACRMVRARYFARKRDPLLRSETIPGVYSADYWVTAGKDGAMTPDVTDLLDNYRVPVVCS